jgi:hypothetical protein
MIIVCCDVDPDVLGYNVPAIRFDAYNEYLGWKGLENISKVREICNSLKDSESNNAKVTWHIRSDAQLKIIYNDYAYPLREFCDLWRNLQRQGDEIGWHPHLWRWSKQNKCWYQEIHDKKWISRCLENGHKEFLKIIPNLTSIRMGWGFHNNFTMKKVNDLGLLVDLSAAPGLKHEGSPDQRGSHFLNHYDWTITPNKPYHPSQQDYRRPAKNNEKSLNILEIPITTAPKNPTRILIEKALIPLPTNLRKKMLRGADIQFKTIQHRYIANITHPSFKNIAKQKFKEAKQNPKTNTHLVAIFHPIELFKNKRLQSLKNNLKTIKELSKNLNTPFYFLTATQMAKEIRKMESAFS